MNIVDYDSRLFFFWIPPMPMWPAFNSWEMWINYFFACFIVNVFCFIHYYFGESND